MGVVFSSNAQIRVSEILQQSSIVETESNKLYFVDFWATWCGPCVYSKKLLTVLQKQYPKDFHVISISSENPAKVEKFINKNPTELTIVVDDNKSTFNQYNITSLPAGILFNAKGDKLWQGHPSDLKPSQLSRFLRGNRVRKPLNRFLKVINSRESFVKEYRPKNDIEIKSNKTITEGLGVSYSYGYLKLTGSVKEILSYLSNIYHKQIGVSPSFNKSYTVYINKTKADEENIDLQVLDKMGLQVTESIATGEVIALKVRSPKFWDTTQINWAGSESKYLVSDNDIQADNVSLKDVSYQLAKALDIPVVVSASDKHLYSRHDWQIHYKYFEFMQSNLEEYGIKVNKETADYPKYVITKKAP
ncbi:hypothetical protein BTO05_05205 [Winogradskyella sp. PC-19]|nr:hypothetical protein BTO05_05205 [Winogradskyella sp. PC-19]